VSCPLASGRGAGAIDVRRGAFKSLSALIAAIQRFLDGWNETCKPFVWVKSAEQILTSMHRQPLQPGAEHVVKACRLR
jgi:hypothetical protein